METNFLVYIISQITITGYKTKTTTALHAFKIHHKLSVVSGLNNACPYPEPALTHLRFYYGWMVLLLAFLSWVKLVVTGGSATGVRSPPTNVGVATPTSGHARSPN